MFVTGNFTIAMDSIKSSKWRSFLTMLGIVIGVASVVTIVSIGEGVKKQVSDQIGHLGADLITVRPGKLNAENKSALASLSYLSSFGGNTFSEADYKVISQIPGVASAVPMGHVTTSASIKDRVYDDGNIVATNEKLPELLNQKVEYGAFFTADDSNRDVAVIGKRVAEELFQETVPIGRSMQIRGHNFVVLGVFEEFDKTPLVSGIDYNAAIFIPTAAGKAANGGQLGLQQILVKPASTEVADQTVTAITVALKAAHANQQDFTVLKQEDTLAIANTILNLLTALISGVAAISLLVGGIGIMNVMLVSVTERTREIGVRKSVGATNQQILLQFCIEAAMISFVGGIIGVLLSLVANFFIRVTTDLEPLITLPIMGVAIIVSLLVGVLFGMTPALKAARKNPIEALRSVH